MSAAVDKTSRLTQIRVNHFLPYVAVLQADLQQTLRGWLYRVWVLGSVLVAIGYVLYRFGAYREAGMVQPATELMTDVMRWLLLGSVTLVIILTAGCISSERGHAADAILSRGISRRQYFLGKWHARLASVLGTFALLTALVLAVCQFLLPGQSLSPTGCFIAVITMTALLAVVVSCAAAVSAMINSTLMGVAIVWMLLYGAGFGATLLPPSYPSPERAFQDLPNALRGLYDLGHTVQLLSWSAIISILAAMAGMFVFSRRDV